MQLHGTIRYAIVWGATLLSEASFMELGKSALPVSEVITLDQSIKFIKVLAT